MKPQFSILTSAFLLSGLSMVAWAEAPSTPKAQYAADSKKALTRYEEDKKLCNDETASSARLQCRRDASSEYNKALSAAKAHLAAANPAASAAKAKEGKDAKAACPACGKVLAVSVTEKAGEGGAVGILAGGAAGALLGHQVGGGVGKDLATIAGAVGGAYAGKKIEEKIKTHQVWHVSVQYGDGRKSSFSFEQDPGLKAGDHVKNSGTSIVRE